jgi:hypothetical protein
MAGTKEQNSAQGEYKRNPLQSLLLHFSSLRCRALLPSTRASKSKTGRVHFSASSGLINRRTCQTEMLGPGVNPCKTLLNPTSTVLTNSRFASGLAFRRAVGVVLSMLFQAASSRSPALLPARREPAPSEAEGDLARSIPNCHPFNHASSCGNTHDSYQDMASAISQARTIIPASPASHSAPYFQLQFGCVLLPVTVNCF